MDILCPTACLMRPELLFVDISESKIPILPVKTRVHINNLLIWDASARAYEPMTIRLSGAAYFKNSRDLFQLDSFPLACLSQSHPALELIDQPSGTLTHPYPIQGVIN